MALKRRFFSAPTLTQALLAAARHHSADPDAIDYQVVEKKQGFIKAPRGVVIEVDPDAPLLAGGSEEASEASTAGSEKSEGHPALESAKQAPAGRSTEVPFEPAPGAEPEEHPGLASVAAEPERQPPLPDEPAEADATPEPATPEATPATGEDWAEAGRSVFAVEAEPTPEGAQEAPEPAADDAAAVFEAGPFAAPSTSADPATETESAGAAVPSPAAESRGKTEPAGESDLPVSDEELREAVAEAIDELAFLASLRVQVSRVESGDDGLEVELEGPDSSRLAARGGRALLAMQHLLPRLLFGRLGRPVRCHLDCDNFHAARSERLERLAQKAADRVRSGGRSWLLEPMAPDERRLVHLALAEVPDVETESVGQGFLKRVRVAQVASSPEA